MCKQQRDPPTRDRCLKSLSNPLDSSLGDWRNTPRSFVMEKVFALPISWMIKGGNTDPKWLLEEQQVDVPDPNPSSASDHPRYQPSIVSSIWSALSFRPAGVIPLPFFNACSLGSKGHGPWMSPHCCLKKPGVGENAATLMLFSLLYRVALQKHTGIAAMPNILKMSFTLRLNCQRITICPLDFGSCFSCLAEHPAIVLHNGQAIDVRLLIGGEKPWRLF